MNTKYSRTPFSDLEKFIGIFFLVVYIGMGMLVTTVVNQSMTAEPVMVEPTVVWIPPSAPAQSEPLVQNTP